MWFKGRRRITPETAEEEIEVEAEIVEEADETVTDEVARGSGFCLGANEI